METKNDIIRGYCDALITTMQNIVMVATNMMDNEEQNRAIIKTMNVQLESIRSQVVILQQSLDNY